MGKSLKPCVQCGELFMPRYQATSLYCSRSCFADARRKPMPTKTCAQCGKTFAKSREYSYAVWAKIKCCSHECRAEAHRKPRTCEQCRERFDPRTRKDRYCSHECYWLSMRSDRFPTARPGNFTWTQKRLIRERDGDVCRRCGSTENTEIDHIVPCHLSGTHDLGNGQVLCRSCHRQKTDEELRVAFRRAA